MMRDVKTRATGLHKEGASRQHFQASDQYDRRAGVQDWTCDFDLSASENDSNHQTSSHGQIHVPSEIVGKQAKVRAAAKLLRDFAEVVTQFEALHIRAEIPYAPGATASLTRGEIEGTLLLARIRDGGTTAVLRYPEPTVQHCTSSGVQSPDYEPSDRKIDLDYTVLGHVMQQARALVGGENAV
ncbi:uncharacterized protein K452DRAFT_313486 [Aplosporella prunicola CBS 121167]|uniref:Uncharacterized protein n=1 Tax=Aplosporella prunicola CBS 121167 TaxID=1176127 RepID=A0A6A6AVV3_9PEZI|nr:uncharacterized protein K452DRAFT_313486 [Aplosporella prunicola CBS 121167]KAF2136079.1 hypothetical protein K452DRAFT_313486 [Aplosporella prunicola CBS 121167]